MGRAVPVVEKAGRLVGRPSAGGGAVVSPGQKLPMMAAPTAAHRWAAIAGDGGAFDILMLAMSS